MKKTLLIILSIIFINITIMLLYPRIASMLKEDVVYIALAGPMNTADGQAMLMGTDLYLDKVNKQGGIDGRKIKLLIYDDKNDKKTAGKIASEIADENKALVVLGHYQSSASIAAGKIYNKKEIPAITGSSTAEAVTFGNNYFSVIPNNRLLAKFMMNYVSRTLKKRSVSIIFANDAYGRSLASGFENTAKNLDIEIRKKWAYDANQNQDAQLKEIINSLNENNEPEMFLLALYSVESAKIVTALKNAEKACSVMTFSGREFFKRLQPGLGSFYCITPYMSGIGNEQAYIFEHEFKEKYEESPTWVSACYYDAAQTAVEAIKKIGIQREGDIRQGRRKIITALAEFYDQSHAIAGVSGYIYFDSGGNVSRPYSVGIYENNKLVPAFSQYQQITDPKGVENIFKKILEGEVIVIDGKYMISAWTVYTDIKVNEISMLGTKDSVYSMDFNLRFRYSGKLDDTSIKFSNSVEPITLGQPVSEEMTDGITTREYRVKADFKNRLDFHGYPFARHLMPVRFRHARLTRDKLIYIPDPDVMRLSVNKSVAEWDMTGISFHSDILTKNSSFGNPKYFDSQLTISYSQFNAEIHIRRKDPFFILKKFSPIIAVLVILYMIYFIRPSGIGIRVLISISALVINTAAHLKNQSDLPVEYMTALEYGFCTAYVFIILCILISILINRLHEQGSGKKLTLLIHAGIIAHPLAVLSVGFLLVRIFR